MPSPPAIPIPVQHLFRPLEEQLIPLLVSLKPADWEKTTSAKKWSVKDVAAHLLDGNLRTLSIQRDHFFGEQPPAIESYQQLVGWLNALNADWVKACQRLSPTVLVMLHRVTGAETCQYYESLDLWGEAIFAVDWAGESKSYNWMHLAREYTEKWHHQQQIRDAVGQQSIMTPFFFHPLMETFMQALPYTFRHTEAAIGTKVQVRITSELGKAWVLEKQQQKWDWSAVHDEPVDAEVILSPETAWKLFCKNLRPHEVMDRITIEGNEVLGNKVLEMVSVMA